MATEEKQTSDSVPVLSLKEKRTRGQRTLFISIMLMFFVSIVVSVVFSIYFLIPRLAVQDLVLIRIREMNISLANLSSQIEELKASCAPAETEPASGKTGDAEPTGDQPAAPVTPAPVLPKAGPAKDPAAKPK